MRSLNDAIEGARQFESFMDKVVQENAARAQSPHSITFRDLRPEERQPGENRAAHRARLKKERRERKVKA